MANRADRKYNVVVIGAGSAGLITAAGTAGLGGRVALVERNLMGGDCLNFGCVPSKALISSSRQIHAMRRAHLYGLKPTQPHFDFAEIFQRMRDRRAKIAPNDSQERFESLGVDVFRGSARFLSPHAVRVGDDLTLHARNFVIAAGSRAAVPPIDGIDHIPYLTNETIFDELHEKPQRLAILGGGPIGCELGQVFQRLGVQVTLIEAGPRILSREDPDVSQFVQEKLADEGVQILCNTRAQSVRQNNGRIELALSAPNAKPAEPPTATIHADRFLVATGRRPNLENLALEEAGVCYTPRGVDVNDHLQTSRPHIYAAGDIIGAYQFTHMADAHARVVVRNVLLPIRKVKIDTRVVPWCTYVEPEVAHVGLNETEAKRRSIDYDCWRESFENNDRAIVADEDIGFAKVLTAKGKDKILGVTIVGHHAGELLHEFVLAMKYNIGLAKLSGTIHAYPTMAQIAQRLGDQYQRSRLTPRAQKFFAWLYRRARS